SDGGRIPERDQGTATGWPVLLVWILLRRPRGFRNGTATPGVRRRHRSAGPFRYAAELAGLAFPCLARRYASPIGAVRTGCDHHAVPRLAGRGLESGRRRLREAARPPDTDTTGHCPPPTVLEVCTHRRSESRGEQPGSFSAVSAGLLSGGSDAVRSNGARSGA